MVSLLGVVIYFVITFKTLASSVEVDIEKRIIGGVKAKIPTYAGNYYVKVVKTTGEEDELNEYCGGVVVGHSWVLTHAWCVEDANQVHLLLGNFTFGAMRSKLRREKFETIIGGENIYFSKRYFSYTMKLIAKSFTMKLIAKLYRI